MCAWPILFCFRFRFSRDVFWLLGNLLETSGTPSGKKLPGNFRFTSGFSAQTPPHPIQDRPLETHDKQKQQKGPTRKNAVSFLGNFRPHLPETSGKLPDIEFRKSSLLGGFKNRSCFASNTLFLKSSYILPQRATPNSERKVATAVVATLAAAWIPWDPWDPLGAPLGNPLEILWKPVGNPLEPLGSSIGSQTEA